MGDERAAPSLPAGAATVIGAVPYVDVEEGTRFVMEHLPRLPTAPAVVVDPTGRAGDRESDVGTFLAALGGRSEPLVLSLTGPITVDLALRSAGLEAEAALRRAVAAVEATARRLLDLARIHVPGAPVLLFLEEPGLAKSMHPTFPVAPDVIETTVGEVVEDLTAAADSQRLTVGIQVPGRADWALLLRTGIGALGAPVGGRLETAVDSIAPFLERGGLIAWGAVPVDEPLGPSPERLWRRLSALWCELTRLGLDPMLLREQSIITPSAGLTSFGVSQVERIVQLTAELATKVLGQTLGARLSIGA